MPNNIHILLDRGMSKEECKAMCTSPGIPLEPKLFFRIIYETCFRPFEVQNLQIENWNRITGEITAQKTKGKYNPKTRQPVKSLPRSMILTKNTNEMLRVYVSQRKKGFIFISEKTENPKTIRYFEMQADKYAKLLSIQKDRWIVPSGRIYRLVSLMALREAGERHHDEAGGDDSLSAKSAGHTMTVKHKYYKRGSFEEAQDSFKKHHPAHTENW